MRLVNLPLVLLLGTLWTANARAQDNIVVNGEFTSLGGGSIPGWTYDGFAYVPGIVGYSGGSFLGISLFIAQDLNTQAGQSYLLQFSIRDTIPGPIQNGPNGVHVYWGAQDLGIFPLVDGSLDWVTQQLVVQAIGAQTTLRFTPAYSSSPWIDSVSVVQVPEPGPAAYLVIAGVCTLLVRQFARRSRQGLRKRKNWAALVVPTVTR